jgi:hypothetical protein
VHDGFSLISSAQGKILLFIHSKPPMENKSAAKMSNLEIKTGFWIDYSLHPIFGAQITLPIGWANVLVSTVDYSGDYQRRSILDSCSLLSPSANGKE